MFLKYFICTLFATTALVACERNEAPASDQSAADEKASEQQSPGEILDDVLAGDHRSDEERARDIYRHPKETLLFFGVEPDMTVVEIWPGGGWYTQIIAPYLKAGGGVYYAAGYTRDGASAATLEAMQEYEAMFARNPALYGDVRIAALHETQPIAESGTADVVLTFRNVHNWIASDTVDVFFRAFYDVLKPGGVLGVVDHRADGATLSNNADSGYVYVDEMIKIAEKAGFEFEASSEINANPNDLKDHPYGVWTLPPTLRAASMSGLEESNQGVAKYLEIGESDRFTLKFRKPIAADGPLLE